MKKQQIQPKKRQGFGGNIGDAFSRSLWRRCPSRSCFWLGTRPHPAPCWAHTQDTGLEKPGAGARWECTKGWHGSSWRRQSQHLPVALPRSPSRLTRNQRSNPKKTDPNPKENTGDSPCWTPSLRSSILEKGDEQSWVSLCWCVRVHPAGNGVGAARSGSAQCCLHPKALRWIFPLQLASILDVNDPSSSGILEVLGFSLFHMDSPLQTLRRCSKGKPIPAVLGKPTPGNPLMIQTLSSHSAVHASHNPGSAPPHLASDVAFPAPLGCGWGDTDSWCHRILLKDSELGVLT